MADWNWLRPLGGGPSNPDAGGGCVVGYLVGADQEVLSRYCDRGIGDRVKV